MAVVIEPSHQYPVTCCSCVTDGSRGAVLQNGICHGSVEEVVPIDIHQCLLIIYGDQTVDVSTVRRWVVYFSMHIFTRVAYGSLLAKMHS